MKIGRKQEEIHLVSYFRQENDDLASLAGKLREQVIWRILKIFSLRIWSGEYFKLLEIKTKCNSLVFLWGDTMMMFLRCISCNKNFSGMSTMVARFLSSLSLITNHHHHNQGYINRGTCSYPEPTSCHVLTSAYVIIF